MHVSLRTCVLAGCLVGAFLQALIGCFVSRAFRSPDHSSHYGYVTPASLGINWSQWLDYKYRERESTSDCTSPDSGDTEESIGSDSDCDAVINEEQPRELRRELSDNINEGLITTRNHIWGIDEDNCTEVASDTDHVYDGDEELEPAATDEGQVDAQYIDSDDDYDTTTSGNLTCTTSVDDTEWVGRRPVTPLQTTEAVAEQSPTITGITLVDPFQSPSRRILPLPQRRRKMLALPEKQANQFIPFTTTKSSPIPQRDGMSRIGNAVPVWQSWILRVEVQLPYVAKSKTVPLALEYIDKLPTSETSHELFYEDDIRVKMPHCAMSAADYRFIRLKWLTIRGPPYPIPIPL
ncbi:hypothetical protein VHEMI04371 [[Torrubiella] hemipterigena]|uniref:Uncharacterized protein n=1 Tax=[Torrubiella] hemipterigena TaxID=1531966 RepID=A0A0A1SV28_9HYPO|nr:hypothetical protein VHEMI04371 [[Torrubiella] hemipterigena]